MKLTSYSLTIFAILLLLATDSDAQAVRGSRSYPMLDYIEVGTRLESVKTPYVVDVRHGEKRIVFIGCVHEADRTHPQFEAIGRYFDEMKPQIAFNEGGQIADDVHYASLDEAIAKDGETAVLKFYADRAGIKMIDGDMDARTEFQMTLKEQPRDRLFLYFVIERLAIPYRYGAYPRETFANVFQRMVPLYFVKNGFPLSMDEQRLDYFESLYQKYMGKRFDVESFDLEAFDYVNDSCPFCAVGRSSKVARDHALLGKIDDALERYDRVIVTFGHGHAMAVEPALQAIVDRH